MKFMSLIVISNQRNSVGDTVNTVPKLKLPQMLSLQAEISHDYEPSFQILLSPCTLDLSTDPWSCCCTFLLQHFSPEGAQLASMHRSISPYHQSRPRQEQLPLNLSKDFFWSTSMSMSQTQAYRKFNLYPVQYLYPQFLTMGHRLMSR